MTIFFLGLMAFGILSSWYNAQASPDEDFWDWYIPYAGILAIGNSIVIVIDLMINIM